MFTNFYLNIIISVIIAEADFLKSAPGCPSGKNGLWLFDDHNICHKVGSKGPCGGKSSNMIFFPHPNREEKEKGFCDCFDARMETEEEIDFINDREMIGCVKDLRSQIFVPERNTCFSVFDQGPCPAGKWLVLNSTNYPVCVKNQCPSPKPITNPLSVKFTFTHSANDKCYETMTRGYCPKSHRLRFSPNDWLPRCRYIATMGKNKPCPPSRQTDNVLRSRCKPGSRRDYLSRCSQSLNPRRK